MGTPVGMIMGVVFWLLVMYGLFVFISNMSKRGPGAAGKEETPLNILRKRYARSEIDADEFTRRKKDLEP